MSITLRPPSIYQTSSPSPSSSPPIDFLTRTWTVTHSTLPMWRHSKNVTITYTALPTSSSSSSTSSKDSPAPTPRLDDLVRNDPLDPKRKKNPRRVEGIDTPTAQGDTSAWDWRGKGLLFWVRSHWEVLGWGEQRYATADGEDKVERWAVTWFEKTIFSAEGVDVYCDAREGIRDETYDAILAALRGLGAPRVVELVERDMRAVAIDYSES